MSSVAIVAGMILAAILISALVMVMAAMSTGSRGPPVVGTIDDDLPSVNEVDWGPPRMADPEEGDPCPACATPFTDEWETRYFGKGIEIGEETWLFTCPGCGHETAWTGT